MASTSILALGAILLIAAPVTLAELAQAVTHSGSAAFLPPLRVLAEERRLRGRRRHRLAIRGKHEEMLHPLLTMHRGAVGGAEVPIVLARQQKVAVRSAGKAPEEDQALCRDVEGWRSKVGASCKQYAERRWCNEDGSYGEGWDRKEFGSFKDWVEELGEGADDACCVCGGGDDVTVQKSELGGVCQQGKAIQDEETCREAAKRIGAGYAMTAHWPVGQPSGCHVDATGKQVWLNTSPHGTPQAKYALLCVVDSEYGGEAEDDDEGQDYKYGEESGEEATEQEAEELEQDQKEEAQMEQEIGKEVEKEQEASAKDVKPGHTGTRADADSPQGKKRKAVVAAHWALATNFKRRVEIGITLHHMGEQGSSQKDIDERVTVLANETKSPAMANFLGDMWKEMRTYMRPLFKEHLNKEAEQLQKQEPALTDKYEDAKKAAESAEGSR